MDYVQVLLIEQEPDTISLISLSISEIKECKLEVCSSAEEAIIRMPDLKPDLVLLAYGLMGKNGLEMAGEIMRKNPAIHLIVSIPENQADLTDRFSVAGARACIIQDKNYVHNLIPAVKKELIAIAERDSFPLPQMRRAEQFAVDENLPDVVFSLDLEGDIVYVNRAISTILGYEQKEVVGMPFGDLIENEQGKRLFECYVHGTTSEPTFAASVPLRNSLGLAEEFDVNFTVMEGETIYGVARKETAANIRESDFAEEIEQEPAELEAHDQEVIPAKFGPYRVVTLLGAGGMGRVYKGMDEQLDRPVAIKVLNKALASDHEHLERFRQEAKILASINHPNIALIYFFGSMEETPFFCMEYLHGGSLETFLQKNPILEPEVAIEYTLQAALGLNAAIEKGIIHLDVKPSNLMLAEKDRLKLVDFGLARKNLEQGNQTGTVVGTPLYIAPEQIQGGVLDFCCDIYSLGITFFQMLYGFVPHSAATLPEIFKRRLYEPLPPRETLSPDVPLSCHEIVSRMTDRDPAKRYQSYPALIEDLESARRASVERSQIAVPPTPIDSRVKFQGALYDQNFAQILSDILRKKYSGKLSLSWIDLYKNVHFKNGKITAVLSNQEGESFLDLFITKKLLTGREARIIQSGSTNLFLGYSQALRSVPGEVREAFSQDMRLLAWRILEGLFSWVVGEYFFEEGDFPDQIPTIETMEVLRRGVMEWMDSTAIRRALLEGNCKIITRPNFQKGLRELDISPEQRLVAFRIGDGIFFQELLPVAGVSENLLFRILYLFRCMDIVTVEESRHPGSTRKAPQVIHAVAERVPQSTHSPATSLSKQTEPASYYFQCAVKSYVNKNYWAVVEYCKKALEYKKEAKVYQLMGQALATHPAFKHEALEAFKQVQNLDPVNPTVVRDIADLYYATGNFALAKSRYQGYLQMCPGDEHALKRLSELEEKKKH